MGGRFSQGQTFLSTSARHMPSLARALGWTLATLLLIALVSPVYRLPIGPGAVALVTGLGIAAGVAPLHALLVFGGLGPFASVLFSLTGSGAVTLHFEEALTLAFLAGWSARRALRPAPLAVAPLMSATAGALIAAALTSAVLLATTAIAEQPAVAPLSHLQHWLLNEYLQASSSLRPPLILFQGLLLVLAAADICGHDRQRRDAVLRVMVLAAAGVATLNFLRLVLASARLDAPLAALAQLVWSVRVSVQYTDVNAAGSYFALILPVALSLGSYARGWLVPSVLVASGVWMSGSRTALASTAAALFVAWPGLMMRLKDSRRAAPAGTAVLMVAMVAAFWLYPAGRNATVEVAVAYRLLTARAAIHLTASDPLFGIGVGRFFERSESYLGFPENAHNNFLQLMAELGIPGLLLFLALVGLALREAWKDRASSLSSGVVAGLVAFLLTCLGGHPLLTPAVSYVFWMTVGMAAVGAQKPTPPHRLWRLLVHGFTVALVATLPLRIIPAVRGANLEGASIGMSRWQVEDGWRYRWAGGRSTFFVSAGAAAARIPLRHAADEPDLLHVSVFLDGREVDRVILRRGLDWTYLTVTLPEMKGSRFHRIDFEVRAADSQEVLETAATDSGGLLAIGRPELFSPRRD